MVKILKSNTNKIFSQFVKEMQEKMNNNYKGILEQNYLLKKTKKIKKLGQNLL